MTSLKPNKITSALRKKGFQVSQTDHTCFTLYVDGLKTPIWTKISHSARDIGEPLIKKMSRQICLDKNNFIEFVNCGLTSEGYIELLLKDGIVL